MKAWYPTIHLRCLLSNLPSAQSIQVSHYSPPSPLNCENVMILLPGSKHLNCHALPFKCPVPSCPYLGFRYHIDMNRCINSKHRGTVPDTQQFCCPIKGCKYSVRVGKGFPRWGLCRRHVRVQHPDVGQSRCRSGLEDKYGMHLFLLENMV